MLRYILLSLFSILFFYNTAAIAKTDTNTVKVVIHVADSYKQTYRATLNYSDSLLEEYGKNLTLAIVANGSGIGLLNSNNSYAPKINKLLKRGVKIFACNTTVKIMRQFQKLPIIKGVKFVPAGVVEVIKLQSQGYLYLKP